MAMKKFRLGSPLPACFLEIFIFAGGFVLKAGWFVVGVDGCTWITTTLDEGWLGSPPREDQEERRDRLAWAAAPRCPLWPLREQP